MNNILCPTDLSPVTQKAVPRAEDLAARLKGSLTLLHVLTRKEAHADEGADARLAMEELRNRVTSVPVQVKYKSGDFIRGIADESREDHVMMVCATHGARGIRQNLFGMDMLKLVRRVEIPSLVLQDHSPAENAFGTIVMPVAAHEHLERLLSSVSKLARAYGSTVHIYQVDRPGEALSEVLLANKVKMKDWLDREGVAFEEVEERPDHYSIGFADATIRYAERVHAGCIAIMAFPSEEFRYIADAEKEHMLTNAPGIPVLCAR